MKKNYNTINATFGSSALDLSTLPAYGNEHRRSSAHIISFEEVAPRTRYVKEETVQEKVAGFFQYCASYVKNYSLLEPLFSGQKAELPERRASRKQTVLLVAAVAAAFIGLSIVGM